MRYFLIALPLLLCTVPSVAQISVGMALPGVQIGINVPVYPNLVRVPGYPVYYAPQAHSNYFFYDGLYWVFQQDNWYASSWYNGPWQFVERERVPLFMLRVPVRYYRQPPAYFRGWRPDDAPRWGEHWGQEWERHRGGWDQWDHRSAPPAAPPPVYQRQYSGNRYPRAVEQQEAIRSGNYRYAPHDAATQQHLQERRNSSRHAEPQQPGPVQPRQTMPPPPNTQTHERRPDSRPPERGQFNPQAPRPEPHRQDPARQQPMQPVQPVQPPQRMQRPDNGPPQDRGRDKGGENRHDSQPRGRDNQNQSREQDRR